MDILEYLAPSTISDVVLIRTVGTTIVPLKDEGQHRQLISGTMGDRGVLVSSVDASPHLTAPTSSSSSSSLLYNGGPQALSELLSSIAGLLPQTAAALQSLAIRNIPMLWSISPPPLHLGPSLLSSAAATKASRHAVASRGAMRSVSSARGGSAPLSSSPRFVALHPHRRLIAVAAPREGSSRHSAILIYDLGVSAEEPKQVLRNILVKGLCGIAWKPGSRNVLCAYGELGIAMFHMSVDPRLGIDVEQPTATTTQHGGVNYNNNFDNSGAAKRQRQKNLVAEDSAPPLVLPSAGAPAGASRQQKHRGGGGQNQQQHMTMNNNNSNNVFGGASSYQQHQQHDDDVRDIGVGCLYPVASQLARFGISPLIDRVALFPDSGRFIACGSTESSGLRIVDVAFSPIEQLYSDWSNSNNINNAANSNQCGDGTTTTSRNQQQGGATSSGGTPGVVIAGTFCGSPQGGTGDMAWLPPTAASTTALLLRAVADARLIDLFAAGVSLPVARLEAQHPVEQLLVSSWPVLTSEARNAALPSRLVEPKPDRHVPVWFLYARAEGVVLNCVSFNEARVQESPVYVTPLIRLSTTAPPRSPTSHPGGRVTRMAVAKECGSRDSGTVLMSVESGHVIAVKITKIASALPQHNKSGGGAGAGAGAGQQHAAAALPGEAQLFAAQTMFVIPSDEDLSSEISAELVGVFSSPGALGGGLDAFTVVTWNGQDGVARIVSVSGNKCEKPDLPR